MSAYCFFNDPATTEIYTLSLHDALPISGGADRAGRTPDEASKPLVRRVAVVNRVPPHRDGRSEEHTSELQSRQYLVCRLLLEKKKNNLSRDRVVNSTLRTPHDLTTQTPN